MKRVIPWAFCALMFTDSFILLSVQGQQTNLTDDQKAELETFKKTRKDKKAPEGWENWPKVRKPENQQRAIPNQWRVEFVYTVKPKDAQKVAEEIATTHDAKILSVIKNEYTCAVWLETDEGRINNIVKDPRVRRAVQNAKPSGRTLHLMPKKPL